MYNKKKELNTFRCGRLLATHTVKWKHNLVLSNSQITSNYELIWFGRPNANKSSNYGYQQDESTARRHLKSPWSLSGSSLHLILVTKRSRPWSWMTPDCSLSIGPPIPERGLIQNLTLKIQGQGHSQGQTRWLHLFLKFNRNVCFSFPGNWTVFGWGLEVWQISYLTGKILGQGHGQGQISLLRLRPIVQTVCLLFVSWPSDHLWLRYSKFRIWPWKFNSRSKSRRKSTKI